MPENPIFSPIDQFVEYQSHARFDVDVPTDLLDWEPPFGGEIDEGGGEDIPDDSEERKEPMIETMWSRYAELLDRDGYKVLLNLNQKLEHLRDDQVQLAGEHRYRREALEELLALIEKEFSSWSGQTPMREIIGSEDFQQEHLPPILKLEWKGPVRRPPRANSSSRISRSRGDLSLDDEFYEGKHIVSLKRPNIQFRGIENLEDIIERLKGRVRRETREIENANKLRRLIEFRKDLLDRFLWTYEIAGETPNATVDNVPKDVRKGKESHRHVLRILKILPSLHDDGEAKEGGWPTEEELKAEIDKWLNEEEFVADPRAVVQGARRLLKKLFSDYENLRPDLYELLIRHGHRFRDWADELDVSAVPSEDPSSEST